MEINAHDMDILEKIKKTRTDSCWKIKFWGKCGHVGNVCIGFHKGYNLMFWERLPDMLDYESDLNK